jgi:dTDP-4-dehydrorhamnose 3,5-epimerase
MQFTKLEIPDVVLCEPVVHGDDRGYFFESFRHDRLSDFVGYDLNFVQDNESKSGKGVLRGLHCQLPPHAQTKLVRVIEGAVLDIAVDIRHGSPTFGKHVSMHLSAENKRQLLIPRGFAHGFVVLSDSAVFTYKVDNYYNVDSERAILFSDPDLKIDWQLNESEILLSGKDSVSKLLSESPKYFSYDEDYYA